MRARSARLACGVVTALAAVSAASSTAAARPLFRLFPRSSPTPPTTKQCEQKFGIACYDPFQIEKAYSMLSLYQRGLLGKGQTIVIVDSFGSPTIQSDLRIFDGSFGLPKPSFRIIHPDGPVPGYNPRNKESVNWAIETSLDVEYAHAMAPRSKILLVETPVAETEGVHGFPQIVNAENYVINHHLGNVISQSFGATEETFASRHSILALRSAYRNALRHHVTVLGASGDAGPTNYKSNLKDFYTHRVNSWPSSDPLVTSVGGTQLHLNQRGERLALDNAWNDTTLVGEPAASGGGVSAVFGRPSYQKRVAGVVGTHRGTPDISMSAAVNGAALVYLGFKGKGVSRRGWYPIGGTSEATPLFAGVVAIADEIARHGLGLLNPTLYRLGDGARSGITDIKLGRTTVGFKQNGTSYAVQGFRAVSGYDLATGLGTIEGNKLAFKLAHKR